MQNRGFGFPTIPIGLKLKVLEKAEKGQGLALKLFNSGRVKYQQHMKHTHEGIGILPLINSQIVQYRTIYLQRLLDWT